MALALCSPPKIRLMRRGFTPAHRRPSLRSRKSLSWKSVPLGVRRRRNFPAVRSTYQIFVAWFLANRAKTRPRAGLRSWQRYAAATRTLTNTPRTVRVRHYLSIRKEITKMPSWLKPSRLKLLQALALNHYATRVAGGYLGAVDRHSELYT